MVANCPFCNATIAEDLLIHGGTCPQCFGEIPGEETPTDPGEEVKAQIAQEHRQQAQRRALAPVLIAVPVVLAAVAAAAWSLQPEPEVEVLAFELDAFDLGEFEAWDGEEPDEGDAVASTDADAPARRPARQAPKTEGSADDGDLNDRLAAAQRSGSGGSTRRTASGGSTEPGVRDVGGPSVSGGTDRAGTLDLSFNARRTAALLEDRDDIKSAIMDMVKARAPRLQQCFERSLKATPALGGVWTLSFTVNTEGQVVGATAEGRDMADAAFEDCMVREMSGWSVYGRLAKEWPISLPLTFRGDG